MPRQAQLSDVFTYLFVIIAGAIIFGFFAFFGFNMIRSSESLVSVEVVNTLEDSLSAFGVAMNTNTYLPDRPWPREVELRITCQGISADDFEVPLPTTKALFSPSTLKGTQVEAWTTVWKFPYKATNLYYLANARTHYVFVGEGLEELVTPETGGIPARFNVEVRPSLTPSLVQNFARGKDFLKVVFFNQAPTLASSQTLRVLEVRSDDFEQGRVLFPTGEVPFFTRELLFGAIFTEDERTYACMARRALASLDAVTRLYLEKLTLLTLKFPSCDYLPLKQNMDSLLLLLAASPQDPAALRETAQRLFDLNQALLGDPRCAHVF